MGSAVAAAIRRTAVVEIGVVDRYEERRARATTQLGARDFVTDAAAAADWADIAILAIKPQDLDDLSGAFDAHDAVVSVLAGTSIATIRDTTGSRRVARIMPNLAAEIAQATVGLTLPDGADDDLVAGARSVASALGTVLEVPERLMHAVTALSGSGIAYVFRFINAMAMAAVREGLPYDQALQGAISVVSSGAQLLDHTGVHPDEMVARVCSPGGTTVAGIAALDRHRFNHAVHEAVAAAARRSRELDT